MPGAVSEGGQTRRSLSPAQPSFSGRYSAMSLDNASYAVRAPSGLVDSGTDSDSDADASFSIIAPHPCMPHAITLEKRDWQGT